MQNYTQITADSLLDQMYLKENQKYIEWSAENVCHICKLENNKQIKNHCKRILQALWKDGKILRKAAKKDNRSIVYCRIEDAPQQYCIPCNICNFPVLVSHGNIRECNRCNGKPPGDGDPAKIYLG